MSDGDDIQGTAHAMADAARGAVLPFFRAATLVAEDKGDKIADGGFDPVTEADRAAEKAMRAVLAERRPGRFGDRRGIRKTQWFQRVDMGS